MELKTHGGRCCGIKIIHGLGCNPRGRDVYGWAIAPKEFPPNFALRGQGAWDASNPGSNFFFEGSLASDTYLQRFDRFLDYTSRHRPEGLVEVAVTDGQSAWFPLLEARGFKRVTTFKNANTGRTVHSYHLVMDGENKPWEAVMDFERFGAKIPEPAEPDPVMRMDLPGVDLGGEG